MIALGLGLTVLLVLCGYSLSRFVAFELTREFDNGLASQARALSMMIEQTGEDQIEFELVEPEHEGFAAQVAPKYFQIWSGTQTIAKSDSLANDNFPSVSGTLEQPGFESVRLDGGDRLRLAGADFYPRAEMHDEGASSSLKQSSNESVDEILVKLVIGSPTKNLENSIATLQRSIFFAFAIVILLKLILAYFLVKRSLKPLTTLANQIDEVDDKRISEPIEIKAAPAELVPVVNCLNELLRRLDQSFQMEKEYSSNVAHEIRTPLAGLKSCLQVALSRDRGADEYRETMSDCLTISQQLSAMVENLLAMARLENSDFDSNRECFDAAEVIEQCWALVAAKAESRLLEPEFNFTAPLEVLSDLEQVRQVVLNLLDNAVSYADPNSKISMVANQTKLGLEIEIRNLASEFSRIDISRVFERFWRSDRSRSDTQHHSGLGLPICRSILQQLGGEIVVEVAPNGEFVAKFNIPNLRPKPDSSSWETADKQDADSVQSTSTSSIGNK